ncbi:MAG: class D sortase [Candidatus Dormibacteraeota bacterium]|nr:class D sortase [Candidatus Dormibacteraeota bacterium]
MAISQALPPASGRRHVLAFRLLRGVSLACLLIGLLLIVTFAYGMWHGYSQQQSLNQQWQQQMGTPVTAPPATPLDRSLQRPVKGIDFAIRVPRLKYFAAVREGTTSTILYSGPGRYPGTVWPGDPGTVGVAAHNVYWINFPQLAIRDEIDLETRYGTYRYRVTGSKIVNPDDRTVLVPDAPGYHLVLTTCWPLWAGAFATQRYVIFADQFSPRITGPDNL